MARPTTKIELLEQSNENYLKLFKYIDELPADLRLSEFPPGTLNRNIRDVLAHIHHWHLLMLDWYSKGMNGEKPDIPAKGYTWKTTPELNRAIFDKYISVSFDEAKAMLNNSFLEIRKLIDSHSDDELFEKKRYKWTGTTSLGAYFISASSSHYDWALKLIKKSLRKLEMI